VPDLELQTFKIIEIMNEAENLNTAEIQALNIPVVMPRFFDVKGREITDGAVIWNPADKYPEQSVKLIDEHKAKLSEANKGKRRQG
jgi:hypothetical protein